MNSLTRVAHITRKGIVYAGIALFSFVVLRMGWKAFSAYWAKRHPPELPPPTVEYGLLPKLNFDEIYQKPDTQLTLQTISGSLPKLPDRAKVFFVYARDHQFLALEETNQIADNLGFPITFEKINENLYKYTNTTLQKTLLIQPTTKIFQYSYPYESDQTLTSMFIDSDAQVISSAFSNLGALRRDHSDLSKETAIIKYLKFEDNTLKDAPAISEANFGQVDFPREKIDSEIPILPQNLKKYNISFLVSGDSRGKRRIVKIDYAYFPIDREKSSTYPLKSIDQAWEEVRSGNYHLANISGNAPKSLPIREVYLAYLDPHYPTNFLQPIYVFEGDQDFAAFVPAISVEWVEE